MSSSSLCCSGSTQPCIVEGASRREQLGAHHHAAQMQRSTARKTILIICTHTKGNTFHPEFPKHQHANQEHSFCFINRETEAGRVQFSAEVCFPGGFSPTCAVGHCEGWYLWGDLSAPSEAALICCKLFYWTRFKRGCCCWTDTFHVGTRRGTNSFALYFNPSSSPLVQSNSQLAREPLENDNW